MAYIRNWKAHQAKLIATAVKWTGTTNTAYIKPELPVFAKLMDPSVPCAKIAATAKVDLRYGFIQDIPGCDAIRVKGVSPAVSPFATAAKKKK
jgi:hypothetical protein